MNVNQAPSIIGDTDAQNDLCTEIVSRVADLKGIDPTEVETPLYHVVDPEALERLYTGAGGHGRTVFAYAGCEVVVSGGGQVQVSEAESTASPKASRENTTSPHVEANDD